LDYDTLDRRLLREFDESNHKFFKNSLQNLFPAKLIPVMIELSGISPETICGEITKNQRKAFGNLMKALQMTITGTLGFSDAIVTSGGVSVKEIDPHTCESKRVSGLYFAGEVLDVDALTGGFNLQIAWSTGYLSGQSAARI
jgi:predicted Rossmann fold flavoprotein